MGKVLFVNACVREGSRTLDLARHVLGKIAGEVEVVNLYEERLAPLDLQEIEIRDKAAKTKDFSGDVFSLARQFAAAETIVLAAPYWDLMFPAVVKNYLEKITVCGLTFAYGKDGIPHGLCAGKRLIYVVTSGGPIFRNFGYEYVAALAKGFYGISKVQGVKAEGLDIDGADVSAIMDSAKTTF